MYVEVRTTLYCAVDGADVFATRVCDCDLTGSIRGGMRYGFNLPIIDLAGSGVVME